MPKRLTIDHVAGSVLAAFALGVLWECRKIPFGSLAEPGPGALPALLAGVLLVCSLAVVAGGRAAAPMRNVSVADWRHGAAILSMCAFFALAIERLGYRITVFAMLLVLAVLVEKKAWRGLVFAAAFALATHFLFERTLRVPLPHGPYGF